jgi:hypothetical protein
MAGFGDHRVPLHGRRAVHPRVLDGRLRQRPGQALSAVAGAIAGMEAALGDARQLNEPDALLHPPLPCRGGG